MTKAQRIYREVRPFCTKDEAKKFTIALLGGPIEISKQGASSPPEK